eukprot:scaffold66753_cov68-Phaeocystis_antarctica.AAC.1
MEVAAGAVASAMPRRRGCVGLPPRLGLQDEAARRQPESGHSCGMVARCVMKSTWGLGESGGRLEMKVSPLRTIRLYSCRQKWHSWGRALQVRWRGGASAPGRWLTSPSTRRAGADELAARSCRAATDDMASRLLCGTARARVCGCAGWLPAP